MKDKKGLYAGSSNGTAQNTPITRSKYNDIIKIGRNKYLLINYLHSQARVIDSEVKEMLLSTKDFGDCPGLLKKLKELGYLMDDPLVEDEMLMRAYFKEQPVQYGIIPSYNCNLRCKYCIQQEIRDSIDNWQQKMTKEEVNYLFAAIEELHKNTRKLRFNKKVVISGGEPLLPENEKIIKLILWNIKKLFGGINIYFTTNGTTVNHYLPFLSQYKVSFKISFSGVGEVHDSRCMTEGGGGTFDIIVKNIEKMKERFPITIKMNMDSQNIDTLPDFADFVISRGWHKRPNFSLACTPIVPCKGLNYPYIMQEKEIFTRLKKIYMEYPQTRILKYSTPRFPLSYFYKLLEQVSINFAPKKYRRSAHFSYIFNPFGDIYPGFEVFYKIGRYVPTLELYEEKIRKMRERNLLNLTKCRNCKYGPICAGGGCMFFGYLEKGDYLLPSCPDFRSLTKTYVPFIYNHYRKWDRQKEVM